MRTPLTKWTLPLLALLSLVVLAIAPADANAKGGPNKKDPECVGDCRDAFRECMTDVREDVHLCVETNCADAIVAARNACQADPGSEACRAARAAARECVGACREAARPAVQACRETLRLCVGACPVNP